MKFFKLVIIFLIPLYIERMALTVPFFIDSQILNDVVLIKLKVLVIKTFNEPIIF